MVSVLIRVGSSHWDDMDDVMMKKRCNIQFDLQPICFLKGGLPTCPNLSTQSGPEACTRDSSAPSWWSSSWLWPDSSLEVITVVKCHFCWTRMKIWVQNFTPKTRKSRLFVFTTKHLNPLLFELTAEVSGVKLLPIKWFLYEDWHSVKIACVTPKKFTPDQIFYTFPVFGLNVQVFGVKVPPMKRMIFIKLYPTSKTRMLLSENLPQSSRFFTKIYPQYPWHFTTLYMEYICFAVSV